MDPLLFPIGHRVGARRIRRGTRVSTLSDDRFGLWALAHTGDTRAGLLDAATELGAPDPGDAVEALLADGLLAEADDTFAARHRIVPLLLGLGNTAEEPDSYRIGLPGQPLTTVDAPTYDLFARAHLESNLRPARARLDRLSALLAVDAVFLDVAFLDAAAA